MNSKLSKIKLGLICDVKGGKRLPKGHSLNPFKTSHPYIRIRDLNDQGLLINPSDLEYINEDTFLLISKYIVNTGDIVLSNVASIGLVAEIQEALNNANLTENCVKLTNFLDCYNPKYIKYFLLSNFGKSEINKFTVGAVQKKLAINRIKDIEIFSHTFEIQNKIAHILSTLDDKIELNHKMNETLEDMAQALFKSWFVDFEPVHAKANASSDADYDQIAKELGISREILDLFPDEFEESELGMIPKGWNVKPFSTVARLSTKSVKPYNEPSKLWIHFSIPAYDNSKYPIHELGSEIKSNKYEIDPSAVLVSKLNPTTERVWLPKIVNQEASICSTEFMQFVPFDSEYRSYIYYLIKSNNFQNEIKSRVTGTTGSRQRSQPPQVAVIEVVNSPREIIEKFVGLTSFTMDKFLSNIEEIQTLKKTRDTLLPKLLSGELDVSELELDHVAH